MVDRAHRVRLRSDFARIRLSGRRVSHPLVRLQWASNGLPVTRFGFVVGRRVAPRAHDRNRVRRRLREIARGTLPHLPDGIDIVFIAQAGAVDASFHELYQAVGELLARSRLERRLASPERAE
ncbi:MAG: ribonuclease P protein component [Chloroflexi bacterium]|nr:ribonuclease P protein component [Chloroflexota bacterium]